MSLRRPRRRFGWPATAPADYGKGYAEVNVMPGDMVQIKGEGKAVVMDWDDPIVAEAMDDCDPPALDDGYVYARICDSNYIDGFPTDLIKSLTHP